MILAIIPAQGTSRRLPGKNMRNVGDRPILYWAIEAARNAKRIDHIIVSTDDHEIAEYADSLGVQCIMRGEELCGDAPVMDVYKDVVLKSGLSNITHIVALQPDHPDRNTDIDAAIEIVLKHRMLDFITTDRFGVRHGSVRIMDRDAMMKDQLYQSTGGAWIDNCINIHTEQDLRRAQASFLRKNRSMMIGQRQVCRSDPALIMVGITAGPDTDLDILKKIVDHAKDAGADGVIFRESPSSYFDKGDLKMAFSYTSETGLIPLIPVSRENDDYFGELSNEAILFPPDKHYDAALLEKAASKNIPVILQIEKTSHETIRSFIDNVFETANRDIILLSCLCAENNVETYGSLKQISELIAAFPEAVVGLSGHAGEINESLAGAAIALGAGVIEIPYPRSSSSGAGVAKVSHIPENLERYINYIRITERALGIGVKYALQPKPDRSGHTDK